MIYSRIRQTSSIFLNTNISDQKRRVMDLLRILELWQEVTLGHPVGRNVQNSRRGLADKINGWVKKERKQNHKGRSHFNAFAVIYWRKNEGQRDVQGQHRERNQ